MIFNPIPTPTLPLKGRGNMRSLQLEEEEQQEFSSTCKMEKHIIPPPSRGRLGGGWGNLKAEFDFICIKKRR